METSKSRWKKFYKDLCNNKDDRIALPKRTQHSLIIKLSGLKVKKGIKNHLLFYCASSKPEKKGGKNCDQNVKQKIEEEKCKIK